MYFGIGYGIMKAAPACALRGVFTADEAATSAAGYLSIISMSLAFYCRPTSAFLIWSSEGVIRIFPLESGCWLVRSINLAIASSDVKRRLPIKMDSKCIPRTPSRIQRSKAVLPTLCPKSSSYLFGDNMNSRQNRLITRFLRRRFRPMCRGFPNIALKLFGDCDRGNAVNRQARPPRGHGCPLGDATGAETTVRSPAACRPVGWHFGRSRGDICRRDHIWDSAWPGFVGRAGPWFSARHDVSSYRLPRNPWG